MKILRGGSEKIVGLISEPTWITDKSATVIDLIFTNCLEKVVCSGVAHISISDHFDDGAAVIILFFR